MLHAETLEKRVKRILLHIILVFGFLAVVLVWLIEGPLGRSNQIDLVGYPLMLIVFGGGQIVLWRRPRYVDHVSLAAFLALAIYITLYIIYLYYAPLLPQYIYSLASFSSWAPLVYVTAFIFLPTRQAISATLAVYLCLLVAGVLRLLNTSAPISQDIWLMIANMLVAHPIYVVTLTVAAFNKLQLAKTRAASELARQVADQDYLTGIKNRRALAHQLDTALALAQQQRSPLSAILIDIDYFKRINDTHGHLIGDQAIIALVRSLAPLIGETETIGRWGGEEFLVLTTRAPADAMALAEAMRLVVAACHSPIDHPMTASFGVAHLLGRDTPDSLVHRADAALYRAKLLGRDRVEHDAESPFALADAARYRPSQSSA